MVRNRQKDLTGAKSYPRDNGGMKLKVAIETVSWYGEETL